MFGGPLAVADRFGGEFVEDAEEENAGFDFVVAEGLFEFERR